MKKKITKWQWALIVLGVLFVFGLVTGPTGTVDTKKNTEVAKAVDTKEVISDVVEPLTFEFPDLNARAEMRCVTPGAHDGFNWSVVSIDGKNPPKATKIYFNLAKSKNTPIVASGWRGIKSTGNKIPIGDAFMITAFQLKDNITKEGYKYFVFGIGNSLEDVRSSTKAVYLSSDLVTMTAALTVTAHPCSSQNK